MTVGADVSSAQSGADNSLLVAEGLNGIAEDFVTACDDADALFSGTPKVEGMAAFQSEYQNFMDSVQVQAEEISDNIHDAAGEIGAADEVNRSEFSSPETEIPNLCIY